MNLNTSKVNTHHRVAGEAMTGMTATMTGEVMITTEAVSGLMVEGGNKPHPSMREGGIVQMITGGTLYIKEKVNVPTTTRGIPSASTTTTETQRGLTKENRKDLMITIEVTLKDLMTAAAEMTDIVKMIKSAIKKL